MIPLGVAVVGSYLPSMKWGGTRSEGGRRGAFAVGDRFPAGSHVEVSRVKGLTRTSSVLLNGGVGLGKTKR